jgi:hypothetical protein
MQAVGGALSTLSSIGDGLSFVAGSNMTAFMETVHGYKAAYHAAVAEVAAISKPMQNRVSYAAALLANALN